MKITRFIIGTYTRKDRQQLWFDYSPVPYRLRCMSEVACDVATRLTGDTCPITQFIGFTKDQVESFKKS